MRATRVFLPLALSLIAGAAQADLLYTFDSNAQGFTATSGGSLTHVIAGGNGHLSVADIDNEDMLLNLPLGAGATNWSGYLGGTLSLDATSLNGQAPSWSTFGLLTLTSATAGSVSFDLVPETDPTTGWQTYSVQLDVATFGANLPAVLASLSSATINLESGDGPIEVVGIDNVRLTSAVPEPQTWAMGLAGLVLIGALRRRARG